MRILYLIASVFFLSACSPDRCATVSDCPDALPCETWVCGATDVEVPGALLGCAAILSPVGSVCDNGGPACAGFCNGDVTCDAPMCADGGS